MSAVPKSEIRLAARHELWRKAARGESDLSWKLHAAQLKVYTAIKSSTQKRVYLNISRQWGKSTLLLLLAWEQCIQKPGTRCNYWASFSKDADDIAGAKADWLLEDCPEDLKPTYRVQDKEYLFKNGSRILFLGANADRARFARGRKVDLHVIDEAAEIEDLNYLVNDVAMPSTLHTNGRIFLASTPARSPGHASTLMAKRCALEGPGAYFHYTIYQNPLLDAETIAAYCKEAGGKESSTWRREYEADLNVVDTTTALIPEFTEELRKEIVRPYDRPAYFPWVDLYVSVDPGMDDATGVIFAWWDPLGFKLVVEDCLLLQRANTRVIAEAIRAKEAEIWPGRKPFLRVIDDSGKRVVADLFDQHQMAFSPARKDDREAAINLLRLYIAGKQLIINPAAEKLAHQLMFATRNPKTGDLERTAAHAHFDLAASAWYLVRTVNDHKARMPIPPGWDRYSGIAYSTPATSKPNQLGKAIFGKTAFGRKVLKRARR